MREKWKAGNPERQKEILIRLCRGDSSFTEIYKSLKGGWSRQTLSLYLNDLVEKRDIKKVPRGKRMIYSLERNSPHVKELLGRIIIHERVELNTLSEQEFIDTWIESMKFSLLNLIQIYMQIGKGVKELRNIDTGVMVPIENFQVEYVSDLVGVCKYYGGHLAEGVKNGVFDSDLVWKARNDLLAGIKRRRLTKIE